VDEMTKYTYRAMDREGNQTKGTTKAVDRFTAESNLREQGLRVVDIAEKTSVFQFELRPRRVKSEEIMHLSRQMGAFIRAGLPLIGAVHTLGIDARNPTVRKMMADVETRLGAGDTLSDCFDSYPQIFPEFYRGILRSAEYTGQLDTVLEQLAKYLERDVEARRKVKSAMIYPSVIAGVSLVTIVVLSAFVLPKFKVFFDSLDAELPLTTRMLLALTDFVSQQWWLLLAGALAIAVLTLLGLRTSTGKYVRDRLAMAIPVIGDAIRFALVERFCRVLSSMASAGVSLPEALPVAIRSLNNQVFSRSLVTVSDFMLEGRGLARPLVETKLFPATAAQMMRVGEETGTLDIQLMVTADYYEGELDYKLKKIISLIEPAVILVMGSVVGFVAIALVSAMYGIFSQVQV
jgi:type IV pilus assembly protein PilC